MTDYRTLFANKIELHYGGHPQETGESAADAILAACVNGHSVADLLRWGENVAKATVVKDHMDHHIGCVHVGDHCLDADDVGLLAALRTEADQ